MTIREGRWRCPRCNRQNLGREVKCGGCGETRGDDVTFYLPEEAPEVTDEQLLAKARAGAERLCEFCDAANPPDATVCRQCGAQLTARQRETSFTPEPSAGPAVPQPLVSAPQPMAAVAQPAAATPGRPVSRGAKLGCVGCLGVAVLALAGFLFGTFSRKQVDVTVTGVSWQRSVEVEELRTLTKTGWKGELPSGARPLSQRQAVRSHRQVQVGSREVTRDESYRVQTGTRQVKTGTRDLGNGFFEDVYRDEPVYETRTRKVTKAEPVFREEPVYGTEVSYEVDEWLLTRTATLEGSDAEPRWPSLRPGERERSGSRKEVCQVLLTRPGGKPLSHKVSAAQLARYRVGMRLSASVDRFGIVHGLQ